MILGVPTILIMVMVVRRRNLIAPAASSTAVSADQLVLYVVPQIVLNVLE